MTGFESLPHGVMLWIVLAMLLAGVIQGTLGFGFPIIATPLVAMVVDMHTAVITVLLPTLASVLVTLVTSGPPWRVLQRFWMMPIYAFLGALAGTGLFIAAPHGPYLMLLGLVIIAYLNLDRVARGEWPLVRKYERAFGLLAGGAAGFFEGTANVAAPPLIIYYLALGLSPAALVQALQICFAVGKITQFSVLTIYGGVSASQWFATLPLILVAIAAGFGGAHLRKRIHADTFRIWVKRALLLIAFALLVQYAFQAIQF